MSAGGGPLHAPFARRALALLCTPPIWRALRPSTPGGLLRDGSPCGPRYARRAGALLCAPPLYGCSARAWLCHARHPGDFLAKRKSPKIRQGPPGPWTPSTRGRTPLDSPTFCPSGIGCGNLNSQASLKPILPSHGLKVESVPLTKPEEKTRPICPPTQSGKSVFCCGRR